MQAYHKYIGHFYPRPGNAYYGDGLLLDTGYTILHFEGRIAIFGDFFDPNDTFNAPAYNSSDKTAR